MGDLTGNGGVRARVTDPLEDASGDVYSFTSRRVRQLDPEAIHRTWSVAVMEAILQPIRPDRLPLDLIAPFI